MKVTAARLTPDLALEVGMIACLFRGQTASRVVDEHHLQKLESVMIEITGKWRIGVAVPFGEGRLEVRV